MAPCLTTYCIYHIMGVLGRPIGTYRRNVPRELEQRNRLQDTASREAPMRSYSELYLSKTRPLAPRPLSFALTPQQTIKRLHKMKATCLMVDYIQSCYHALQDSPTIFGRDFHAGDWSGSRITPLPWTRENHNMHPLSSSIHISGQFSEAMHNFLGQGLSLN